MFLRQKKTKQTTRSDKKRAWGTKLAVSVAAIGLSVLALMPSVASASDSYFLTFTFNAESRMIVPGVTKSEVKRGVENHAEIENGANYLWNSGGDLLFLTNAQAQDGANSASSSVPTDIAKIDSFFIETRPADKYNYTIPFSFPGRHVGTNAGSGYLDGDSARNGSSSDQAQANRVGQQLTSSFNRLFGDAHTAAGGGKSAKELAKTASRLANAAIEGGSVTFGEGTTSVIMKFDSYVEGAEKTGSTKGIPISYYRKVTITGGADSTRKETTMVLPVQIPKGYAKGQYLYDRIENTPYHDEEHHLYDVHYISWQHMVMQAMTNARQGIFLSDVQQLNPPGAIETLIVDMMGGLTGMIKGFLGLESIPDLVFNKGIQQHEEGTVYGTMPVAMGQVADFVFFLILILSAFVLLGSFVSLLIKSNLSAINPQMRVDLKDGLMTVFGAFFILIIFQPLWSAMMQLNYHLVDFFYNISTNVDNMGTMLVSNSGSIAGIILSIAFLVVEIWFNFYYIVRALTLMVLYMFAPLMIISIAYGGKFKQIFSNWSKEILGALFIQSIHAAILGAIAAGLDQGMAQSLLWQYVILISIIPLSNLFRKSILNLGGDSLGSTAGRAEKATMMAGAIGGGLALRSAATVGSGALGVMSANGASGLIGKKMSGNGGGGKMSSGGAEAGNGGGGGKQGQNALRDEPADYHNASIKTAQGKVDDQNRQTKMAGGQPLSDKKQAKNEQKAYNKNHKMEAFDKKVQKGAQWAQSDKMFGGSTLGTGASNTVGALMTAGVVAGDMSTETDSQSAMIAGAKILRGGKGGGKGNYKGGHSDNSYGQEGAYASANADYTSPSDILSTQPPAPRLEALANNSEKGSQGALINQRGRDGKDTVTFDKKQMQEDLGISNISTLPPDSKHPNGRTRMEYDNANLTPENEAALENAANVTEKIQSGNVETISNKEWKSYSRMTENSRISNVTRTGDGYAVDVDNQQAGWSGTAVDKNYFMLKSDSMENKNVPDFRKNNPDTAHFREWNRSEGEIERMDKLEQAKATGGAGSGG